MGKHNIILGLQQPIQPTSNDTYEELRARCSAWAEWYNQSLKQVYAQCARDVASARHEVLAIKAELAAHSCVQAVARAEASENRAWKKLNALALILGKNEDDIDE